MYEAHRAKTDKHSNKSPFYAKKRFRYNMTQPSQKKVPVDGSPKFVLAY